MGLSSAEIDEKLDDVATSMMSGQNDQALMLLSLIIEHGDDIQREMAESYKIQIEMMLELESQDDFVDDSKEQSSIFIADERSVEVSVASDVNDMIFDEKSFIADDSEYFGSCEYNESSNNDDSQIEDSFSEYKSSKLHDIILPQKSSVSESRQEKMVLLEDEGLSGHSSEVLEGTLNNNDLLNVSRYSVNDDLTVEVAGVFEQDKESLDVLNTNDKNVKNLNFTFNSDASVVVENKPSSVVDENDDLMISKDQQEEINLTHDQVEVLIDDDEFETAQIVLNHVLGLGCDKQQKKSNELNILIKKELSLQYANDELQTQSNLVVKEFTSEIFNNDERISDDKSFIDSIFKDDFSASESFDQSDFIDNEQDETEVFKSQINDSPVGQINELKTIGSMLESDEINDIASISDKGLILNQEAFNSMSKKAEKNVPEDGLSVEEDFIEDLLRPSDVLGKATITSLTELNKSEENGKLNKAYFERQGFIVGGIGMMISFEDGSELTSMPKYYRVPNSPVWLVGLTNLHGLVIPVVNLEKYFGLQQSDAVEKSMLLVLNHGERAVGVIIHGLPERFVWSNDEKVSLNTCPKSIRNHVNSALKINDGLWFDMNVDSLTDILMEAA